MTETANYQADFHAWALANAGLLREGRLSELDSEHIAEELQSLGASERRELLSRLQILILHLLRYQYQPERRASSWLLTINHQRTAIERLLEQSRSLRALLSAENLARVDTEALRDALIETDLERHVFPGSLPYAEAQILDEDWLPDAANPGAP